MDVKLNWNIQKLSQRKKDLEDAQKELDSEAIRLMDPKVPMDSGTLKKSGIINTVVGSGEIIYSTPYARTQYEATRKVGSPTGPDRGPQWFERMKAEHGKYLRDKAARKIK